jgi:hypothetical protein
MKKVICVNDKNLPQGANITENEEYEVINEYVNALDQRVYIIKGAINEGTTKWGMRWIGYDALRFKTLDLVENENVTYNFNLN